MYQPEDAALAYAALACISVSFAYLWPKDPPPLPIVWSLAVFPLANLMRLWLLENYGERLTSTAIDAISMIVALIVGSIGACLIQQRRNIILLLTVAYALFVMNVEMSVWYGVLAAAIACLVLLLSWVLRIGDRIFYLVYAISVSALLLWQLSLFWQLIHNGETRNLITWWMFLIYIAIVGGRLAWVYHWQWSRMLPEETSTKKTHATSHTADIVLADTQLCDTDTRYHHDFFHGSTDSEEEESDDLP